MKIRLARCDAGQAQVGGRVSLANAEATRPESVRKATNKGVYRDISLFDEPVDEVLGRLRQTTEVVESEDEPGYSFTAAALLLALWGPTLPSAPGDSDSRNFEGVLMASPGYYDS